MGEKHRAEKKWVEVNDQNSEHFWWETRGKFGGKSLRAMGENLGAK